MEKLERLPAWDWEEREEEKVDESEWPEAEDAEEVKAERQIEQQENARRKNVESEVEN